MAWLKEREPANLLLRERLAKEASSAASRKTGDDDEDEAPKSGQRVGVGVPTGPPALPPGYSAAHPPRPRKKGRR